MMRAQVWSRAGSREPAQFTDWLPIAEAESVATAQRRPDREAWIKVERPEIDRRYGELVFFGQVLGLLDAIQAEMNANGEIAEAAGVQRAMEELRGEEEGG